MARPEKISFAKKAAAAWGEALPVEVRELAAYADRHSGVAAAKAIGYSPSLVSHVIANSYPADMPPVFDRIRGALLGDTVTCPVLGEIGRDLCLIEQKKPFATSNSARARLFRACRSGCPHSRLKVV